MFSFLVVIGFGAFGATGLRDYTVSKVNRVSNSVVLWGMKEWKKMDTTMLMGVIQTTKQGTHSGILGYPLLGRGILPNREQFSFYRV